VSAPERAVSYREPVNAYLSVASLLENLRSHVTWARDAERLSSHIPLITLRDAALWSSLAGDLRTRSTTSRRQRRELLLIHNLGEAKVGEQQVRVFVFGSVEQVFGLDVCKGAAGFG